MAHRQDWKPGPYKEEDLVIHTKSNVLESRRGFNYGPVWSRLHWPRDLRKGKVFLVNETFVRVDGVDYVNLRSEVGRYKWLEINTSMGATNLVTPKCEGYVFAPIPRWFSTSSEYLMNRCMTGAELREAQQDHIFLRNVRPYRWEHDRNPYLWIEYSHDRDSFLDSNSADKLMAFNRALHKKRQQEHLRRTANGEKYDYADLINSTFDPKKHTLRGPQF